MNINAEQFRLPSERNIHVFLDENDVVDVAASMSDIAQSLGYHLAVLDGMKLHTERDILVRLAQLYDFPNESGKDYENLSWNGASDWLGDLSWIMEPSTEGQQVAGFILLYQEPMIFYRSDPVGFAMFLDVVCGEARRHIRESVPFHVVLGPTSPRAATFMNTLRVSSYVTYL